MATNPAPGDLPTAIQAARKCIEQSDPTISPDLHFQCRFALARNYYDLGQPWEAERTILPAIDFARSQNRKELLFQSLLFQQEILNSTDRPEESWPILQECQILATELNDSLLLAKAYYSTGYFILYYNKLDDETGMQYLENALGIFTRKGDLKMMAPAMRRIARYTKDKVKAENYLQAAIELYRNQKDEISLGWAYYNLASFYRNQQALTPALQALEEALTLHRKNDLKGGVADVLLEIGWVHLAQQKPQMAIAPLTESLALAQSIPLFPNIRDATAALAEAYATIGKFDQAYKYLEQNSAYKDSTFYETLNRQMAESNARYENEQLEKSIAERELEIIKQKELRNRILATMGFVLLLALIAFQIVYHRQKRNKDKAELALGFQSREAERLRALNELKSNFFTNISHELRTPLTLILSPLADVLERIKAKPLQTKLGIVHRNAQQLLNLVNEIMDLSKAEVGKLTIYSSSISLQHLVKRIFSSYESLAALRDINYDLSIQCQDVMVEVDIDKFEKILNNLLTNALKFTAAQGSVHLDVGHSSGNYTFTIKDTGQGIHPDDQARIFDRFYQSDKSDHLRGGTGIGLALAKELSQILNGQITVSSEWGKGSTFQLILPLKEVPQTKVTALISPGRLVLPTHPKRVPNYAPLGIQGDKARLLIVEDHPEMGKYLLEVLSEHYQCVLAQDGQQALKQLRLSSFSAITSDVMMPNMDGFQLRETINQKEEWRQIPFLLLTARHLEEDKIRGFQLGIDDYITKPFSTKELLARINNLVRNKEERDKFVAKEPDKAVLSVDQNLLKTLEDTLLSRLEEEDFKVDDLAEAIHYSTKQMGRLIKKHTGLSSVQFILEVRLQKARTLLAQRQCATVLEAQFAVGIRSTSYFTRKFTERFGKNPKDYLKAY
ncbi:MAG: hybrid sensor histidine kinase/response regulator transcription factor [Lewinella sp.]|uniref:hybrid sensor histidine kinase/response regulator transcription factor n=1 Tax=Lewinella sp. TaxID=2004506 RepID=UPI003D6B5D20